MARRLVEYFVAAGISKKNKEKNGVVKGSIVQRYPINDRKDTPLPTGFEIFCQPMGWSITTVPEEPYFINLILTAEDSSRLFCTCLNFHQLHKPAPKTIRRHIALLAHIKTPPEEFQQPSRCVDYSLDEENEAHWSPEAAIVPQEDVYEPFSLALLSKFPVYETLQVCLKSIYVSWVSSKYEIERLITQLMDTSVPPLKSPPIKMPFGHLRELVIHPIDEPSTLPYSSTCAIALLKSIGVHNIVSVIAAVLSDLSILIVSSSYTALTYAVQAIWSLVYPFKITHSLVPIVPAALLDYIQLPSVYIMGVHADLKKSISEMPDVVLVDLDDGSISIPNTIVLLPFPDNLKLSVEEALIEVLHPSIRQRDAVFPSALNKCSSMEIQDREVRAVFLCLFVHLLGNYKHYTTVIRFHPHPCFAFRKDSYLAQYSYGEIQNLVHKIADSIAFINFCHDRAVPYRTCDFFDELVLKYSVKEHWTVSDLFSRKHVQELAQRIEKLLPMTEYGTDDFDLVGLRKEDLNIPPRRFPNLTFDEAADVKIGSVVDQAPTNFQIIPLLEHSSVIAFQKQPGVSKELEMLRSCLDAVFFDRLLEARKYLPIVTTALSSCSISTAFYSELVHRVLKFGGLVKGDQFDILVRLMNSALADREMAAILLPLVNIIYRQVLPGVQQELSTCVQNHHIWNDLAFWKDALLFAVQAELVRVYAEYEVTKDGKLLEESNTLADEVFACTRERLKSAAARIQPSNRTLMALSRSARIRLKASVPIPSLSEGILPPGAQPVSVDEALHHLAKRLMIWPTFSEQEKLTFVQQEENAVQNQLVLFIDRIIALRTPLDPVEGEAQKLDLVELEEFIVRFIKSVESSLCFEFANPGKIKDQVHDSVRLHLESLGSLQSVLKKEPVSKPTMIQPPILPGEDIHEECIHCYLLEDGRDNGLLLPSEGHFFVTTYRIIFIGIPCDPQAPNVIVTRSAPLASVFRIKSLPTVALSELGLTTSGGLQIRTLTAELIRLGYGEDMSQSEQNTLFQHLQELRGRNRKGSLGLRTLLQPKQLGLTESMEKPVTKSSRVTGVTCTYMYNPPTSDIQTRSETVTRMKLVSDLCQSPCGQEYKRLGFGSLYMKSPSKKGPWRVSDVNALYALCTSYPAVIAVPNDASDDLLRRVSSQFLQNRLPAAIWKHHKNHAVLMRSASFLPSGALKKPSGSNLIGISSNVSQGALHEDITTYLRHILDVCYKTSDSAKHSNNTLQNCISTIPETITFDSPELLYRKTSTCIMSNSFQKGKSDTDAKSPPVNKITGSSQEAKLSHALSDTEIQLNDIIIEGHDGTGSPQAIDWEAVGCNQLVTPPKIASPDGSSEADGSSSRPDELSINWQFIAPKTQKKKESSSSFTLSSIPTRPRDWIVMHALPNELKHWNASTLYIFGNRASVQDIEPDGSFDATFVPVDVHSLSDVHESFKKLLRCCAPVSSSTGFLSGIDDSKWLSQLCTVMQLAGAVADLIDVQGSSVLVCLEDGWDITAQVVSLAEILLEPHYRTLGGFKTLIEKDWLSFGHKFSERCQHTASKLELVTPIFLQFLDAVHQILRQFPLEFEFNDFYLRCMAYHHCSMRFHTFSLDCEKERYNNNWLKYRPRLQATHGDAEPYISYWKYVEGLHNKSTMFYNFKYQPDQDNIVLRPYSYQANLDVWSFYLENKLSQFPSYDVELIFERDLTLIDMMSHNIFDRDQQSLALAPIPLDPYDSAIPEISALLKCWIYYQGSAPKLTWMQVWKLLEQSINLPKPSRSMSAINTHHDTKQFQQYRQTLHKRTSLAVLIKGKFASELGDPHSFEQCTISPQLLSTTECDFCKVHLHMHGIEDTYQCKKCECICHSHCKSLMPANCVARVGASGSSTVHITEGYLSKKGKIVKNWKQRKFVLNPSKGELTYLEDDKTQGCILVRDITAVEAEPQTAIGQKDGFYFNLCTPKRIFNLMAQTEEDKKMWIESIIAACKGLKQNT